MPLQFKKIQYAELNNPQQENFNFQKASAVLTDFGYATIRLSSDWNGADFIAQHLDGSFLKVQLKGRLSFDKKYEGKDIHVCFQEKKSGRWYLYSHDELLPSILQIANVQRTYSNLGGYNFPSLSQKLKTLLESYCLPT
jgi:hypothetical protein